MQNGLFSEQSQLISFSEGIQRLANSIFDSWKELNCSGSIKVGFIRTKSTVSDTLTNYTKDPLYIECCLLILENFDRFIESSSFVFYIAISLYNLLKSNQASIQILENRYGLRNKLISAIFNQIQMLKKIKERIISCIAYMTCVLLQESLVEYVDELISTFFTTPQLQTIILDILIHTNSEGQDFLKKSSDKFNYSKLLLALRTKLHKLISGCVTPVNQGNNVLLNKDIKSRIVSLLCSNIEIQELNSESFLDIAGSPCTTDQGNALKNESLLDFILSEIKVILLGLLKHPEISADDDRLLNGLCSLVESSISNYLVSDYLRLTSNYSPSRIVSNLDPNFILCVTKVLGLIELLFESFQQNPKRFKCFLYLGSQILGTLTESFSFLLALECDVTSKLMNLIEFSISCNRYICHLLLEFLSKLNEYLEFASKSNLNEVSNLKLQNFLIKILDYIIKHSLLTDCDNGNYSKFYSNDFTADTQDELEPDYEAFLNHKYEDNLSNEDLSVTEFRKYSKSAIRDCFKALLLVNSSVEKQTPSFKSKTSNVGSSNLINFSNYLIFQQRGLQSKQGYSGVTQISDSSEIKWCQHFFDYLFTNNNLESLIFVSNSIFETLLRCKLSSIIENITSFFISICLKSNTTPCLSEQLELLKWFDSIISISRHFNNYFDDMIDFINCLFFLGSSRSLSYLSIQCLSIHLFHFNTLKPDDRIQLSDKGSLRKYIIDLLFNKISVSEGISFYAMLSQKSRVDFLQAIVKLNNLSSDDSIQNNYEKIMRVLEHEINYVNMQILNKNHLEASTEFIVIYEILGFIQNYKDLQMEEKSLILSFLCRDLIIKIMLCKEQLLTILEETGMMQNLSKLFVFLIKQTNSLKPIKEVFDIESIGNIHNFFMNLFISNPRVYYSAILLLILYINKIKENFILDQEEENLSFINCLIQLCSQINSNFSLYVSQKNFIENYSELFITIASSLDLDLIHEVAAQTIVLLLDTLKLVRCSKEATKKILTFFTFLSKSESKIANLYVPVIITKVLKTISQANDIYEDFPKYELCQFIAISSRFNPDIFVSVLNSLIENDNNISMLNSDSCKCTILATFAKYSREGDESTLSHYIRFISRFVSVLNKKITKEDLMEDLKIIN